MFLTHGVVCSDDLKPDPSTHRCANNGAKVDLTDSSYSKDWGAAELSTTWTDPNFKQADRAFYYVQVLENPTCRWSTYDAINLKTKVLKRIQRLFRERASSSPIWYEPSARQIAGK